MSRALSVAHLAALLFAACGSETSAPLDAARPDAGTVRPDAAAPDAAVDDVMDAAVDPDPDAAAADAGPPPDLEAFRFLRIEMDRADVPRGARPAFTVVAVGDTDELDVTDHPALALTSSAPEVVDLGAPGRLRAGAAGRAQLQASIPRDATPLFGTLEVEVYEAGAGTLSLLPVAPARASITDRGDRVTTELLAGWRATFALRIEWARTDEHARYRERVPMADVSWAVSGAALSGAELADAFELVAEAAGEGALSASVADPAPASVELVVSVVDGTESLALTGMPSAMVGCRTDTTGFRPRVALVSPTGAQLEVSDLVGWSASAPTVAEVVCTAAEGCRIHCRTPGEGATVEARFTHWGRDLRVVGAFDVWALGQYERAEVSPSQLRVDTCAPPPFNPLAGFEVTAYPAGGGPTASYTLQPEDSIGASGSVGCCSHDTAYYVAYRGIVVEVPVVCP